MAAVAFVAKSVATAGNLPSFAFDATGADYLVVGVADWNVNPLSGYGTGCTFNGVAMTPIDDRVVTPAGFRWFGLAAPASGSHTVTVTGGSGAGPMAVAMSFVNVHQTVPFGTPAKAGSGGVAGTTATVNVTGTSANGLVLCLVSHFDNQAGLTIGAGQSNESKGNSGNTGISLSTKASTAGTVTVSETWTGATEWAIGAVELLPGVVEQAVSGGITPTGALTSRSLSRTLAGGITPTSMLLYALSRTLAGAITPTGAVAKSLARALSGAITPVGSLVKSLARTLVGAITPSGALDRRKAIFIPLDASCVRTVNLDASLIRTVDLEGQT